MNFSRIKLLLFVSFFSSFAFISEKDSLHKRTFHISLDEVRDGVPVKKMIADEMLFKHGKLFCQYIFDKYGFAWIRYRINKDSTYIDSTETEVRMLEVEAAATDETDQTVLINFITEEWDIDGTIKITRHDKIKKYYDFVGREKGGKPKKHRVKRNHMIQLADPNGPGTIFTNTNLAAPGTGTK
mgnify:CR=1 FL=1